MITTSNNSLLCFKQNIVQTKLIFLACVTTVKIDTSSSVCFINCLFEVSAALMLNGVTQIVVHAMIKLSSHSTYISLEETQLLLSL